MLRAPWQFYIGYRSDWGTPPGTLLPWSPSFAIWFVNTTEFLWSLLPLIRNNCPEKFETWACVTSASAIVMQLQYCLIFTARVRSTREGNVFSFLSVHRERVLVSHTWSFPWGGSIPVRSGARAVPLDRTGGLSRQDSGYPRAGQGLTPPPPPDRLRCLRCASCALSCLK